MDIHDQPLQCINALHYKIQKVVYMNIRAESQCASAHPPSSLIQFPTRMMMPDHIRGTDYLRCQ